MRVTVSRLSLVGSNSRHEDRPSEINALKQETLHEFKPNIMPVRLFKPKERIVATVGLQGHGKTVFLASLLWECYDKLAENLNPCHVRAVSPKADEVFHANAQLLDQLKLPEATQRMKSEPAILKFTKIPHQNG
ncbi:MAG: hypothetical protein ACREA2_09185 [Blastocatellia bacterium]